MTEAVINEPVIASKTRRYRQFKINLWLTGINDVELGILPHTQNRAKSDQFTKDMDVLGEVIEDGERTGVVAYRESLWRDKSDAHRRLVFKLFSKTINWRATMEMTIGRSLQLTLGSGGVPVTAYSVNLARHDQMIHVERSAHQWPFFPEKFSFFLMEGSTSRFYTLRQNLISVGSDYSILDHRGRRIGYIDGKLFTVSGSWNVHLAEAHNDPRLVDVLQLFCTMLKFNKSARAHIQRLAQSIKRGRTEIDLDHHEKDLYANPRRRR